MNLFQKVTKTHLLLLLMAFCFFASIFLIYRKASSTAPGTDYTISTAHRDTEIIEVPEIAAVNVNTATAEELQTLPGIGPVTAQRIIEYREEYGPFLCIDDLAKVKGIGQATLEQLWDLVVFTLP